MVNYKEKFAEAKTIAINEGFESTRAEWLFLDVLVGQNRLFNS